MPLVLHAPLPSKGEVTEVDRCLLCLLRLLHHACIKRKKNERKKHRHLQQAFMVVQAHPGCQGAGSGDPAMDFDRTRDAPPSSHVWSRVLDLGHHRRLARRSVTSTCPFRTRLDYSVALIQQRQRQPPPPSDDEASSLRRAHLYILLLLISLSSPLLLYSISSLPQCPSSVAMSTSQIVPGRTRRGGSSHGGRRDRTEVPLADHNNPDHCLRRLRARSSPSWSSVDGRLARSQR